jgi:hypothetical protein
MTETIRIYLKKLKLFQQTNYDYLLDELDAIWLSMSDEELDYLEEKLKLKEE